MNILIAPLHYVINADEGSEFTRAYETLLTISKDGHIKGDAIVGYSNLKKVGNFDIHSIFKNRPEYISNIVRVKFILGVFLKSIILQIRNNYNVIWHYGPFAIFETFSLVSLFNFKGTPFVIGPIFSPHTVVSKSESKLLGRSLKGEKVETSIWQSLDAHLYKGFSKITKRLSLRTLESASAVYVVEKYGYNILRENKIKRLVILPFSIIQRAFEKTNRTFSKRINLLSVCYLLERKRTDVLIRAMNIIVNKKMIKNIHLTIVGAGPQKEDLESQVVKLNLQKYVTFKGFIPRNKIGVEYKNSDIFLSGSVSDSMPGMYFEAMSASLPMVIAENNTSMELEDKKFGGVIIKNSSHTDFAKQIIKLASNKKLMNKMGNLNHALMKSSFNLERNIEIFKRELSEIIS